MYCGAWLEGKIESIPVDNSNGDGLNSPFLILGSSFFIVLTRQRVESVERSDIPG